MTKDFHRKYVRRVRNFCKSLPPVIQVTTDELDTYFRSCAVYLWANLDPQLIDPFRGINRLYTDSRVKFTRQKFDEQINFYQSNPGETVGVPDFFLRMLKFDKDSNTDNSRRFIDIQAEVLTMIVGCIESRSNLDNRRAEWMREQLVIICDQAAVGLDGSQGELAPIVTQEDEDAIDKESAKEMEEMQAQIRSMFFLKHALDEQDMTPSALLDSALAELHQLIGMEPIEKEIMNLVDQVKASRLQEEGDSKRNDKHLHLAFTGNPGTGKTTVARIIGKICKAHGILSEGHTVEVMRLDLVDSYGERTAAKTQAVIESAIGGVLFIDDANTLAPADKAEDHGSEAIAMILNAMENQDDLLVIISGKADQMNQFIQSNPALQSSFKHQIHFADYTPSQLTEILQQELEAENRFLDEPAKERMTQYIEKLYEGRDESFRNAYKIQNLAHRLTDVHERQLAKVKNPSDKERIQITVSDVKKAIARR